MREGKTFSQEKVLVINYMKYLERIKRIEGFRDSDDMMNLIHSAIMDDLDVGHIKETVL